MRNFTLSLLGLCITLGAGACLAAPAVKLNDTASAAQSAQWLTPLAFMPEAERLQVAGKALQLIDRNGQVASELPGRFESLDQRADADGLLIATLDKKRQQALVLRFDQQRWGTPYYLPRTRFAIEGLCLYRDVARNDFMFLLGEEGVGEQWLVAVNGQPLAEARRVRSLSLPPQSQYCQVDDSTDSLYVNEENVGLWRYPAAAEAALEREPVELREPFGRLAGSAGGMALVPGGLLLLDPKKAALHLYQRAAGQWQRAGVVSLGKLAAPEQVSARVDARGLNLLLNTDDDQLRQASLNWKPKAVSVPERIVQLAPLVQTDGVPSLGDAADDPAIWINSAHPELSRVLGTDKKGGLLAYDLTGKQVQHLQVGRLNNVDVRPGFALGERQVDLAVATNRDSNSLQLFAIDPASGELSDIGQLATPFEEIYGMCLFKDRDGAIHAIANGKGGSFLQYRLNGAGGKVSGELVRRFSTQTQPEGCVADDRNERLFIGEEDVAVWTLGARADASVNLEKVIGVGAALHDDIEGMGLYHGAKRDYLVVSSQGNDSYLVLETQAPYRLRGSFRVGINAQAGIDGASETDGLEVTSANLAGAAPDSPWRAGMLVVQDGRKRMPEGNQNYKYVPWSAVADALGLE